MTNLEKMLLDALLKCAAVEPTRGKKARNAAALLQIQAIARSAVAAAQGPETIYPNYR